MKELNAGVLLDLLRYEGPLTRPKLAEIAGLSLPTVNARVKLLLEEGYVREGGVSQGEGSGRPARLVEFNAELGYVIGVDVGGFGATVELADLLGRAVACERFDLPDGATGERVLDNVLESIERLLRSNGLSERDVLGLGLSTPGLVDPETGDISYVPNIPGWSELRPKRRLSEAVGAPVAVENNVNAAMEGERLWGAARGVLNAVFVAFDRGIGAGLMIGGVLHRGQGGAAGEVGLQREWQDREPLEGLFGPFERQASGLALMNRYRELNGEKSEICSPMDVFMAADSGDADAQRAVSEITSLIAGGMTNLCAILAPELVVLGGSVTQAGEALAAPVRERMNQTLPVPPQVVVTELGDRAPVLGTVGLALGVAEMEQFSFGVQRERDLGLGERRIGV